ncbi:CRAL/TRIO domain protein [Delitschia confertaspora ATCC 74209]|uniref:CRAL/TRIO domain protein n=1 Tax=Delitschia confertaspora ATCC 74209 TaxID=1513339 RepID=A0A9P4JNW7_9PLEO|nr:CRAL/TRIO domain protein [Delitschia confertaspora ATCC 74209]
MMSGIGEMSDASANSTFKSFVQLCEDQGLLNRHTGLAAEDVSDGFNDEVTLRRFFVARTENSDGAVEQFKEAVEIRNSINDIAAYENISVRDYEATRKLYPHWSGRRDKRGLPIVLFDIGDLDKAALTEYNKLRDMPVSKEGDMPNLIQRTVAFHDTFTRFILPLCSSIQNRQNPEIPISDAVYLVDIARLGLKQGLDLRNYAQDISKLLATNFPEVVNTVYVLNAPTYFSTIWALLKKFVDPRTASKLVFLSPSDVLPTLSSTIDLENIPKEYGGTFEFEYGSVPILDMELAEQLEWLADSERKLPPGPIKWIADEQGSRTAVAVGRINGKPRQQRIATLKMSTH